MQAEKRANRNSSSLAAQSRSHAKGHLSRRETWRLMWEIAIGDRLECDKPYRSGVVNGNAARRSCWGNWPRVFPWQRTPRLTSGRMVCARPSPGLLHPHHHDRHHHQDLHHLHHHEPEAHEWLSRTFREGPRCSCSQHGAPSCGPQGLPCRGRCSTPFIL